MRARRTMTSLYADYILLPNASKLFGNTLCRLQAGDVVLRRNGALIHTAPNLLKPSMTLESDLVTVHALSERTHWTRKY